jgi:anti-sigma B factor antagonist
MPRMEFGYDEVDNDVLILKADGGLNADTAEQFVREIEQLVDTGLVKIIVDCSGLTYVSSRGLGVLVRLHGRMAKHGGEVKIAGITGLAAQVLAITRLSTLFAMYPDVNRARLAFRPPA